MNDMIRNQVVRQRTSAMTDEHSFHNLVEIVVRIVAVVLLLGALAVLPASASSTYAQPEGFQRVNNFLQDRQNGIEILGYLHLGADYHGHKFQRVVSVVDANGDAVPEDFGIVYRFFWADDGITDVAFLCHRNGQIYKSTVTYTNGIASKPFRMANLAIGVVGELLIESNKHDMTKADLDLAHDLVNRADAHGLMDLWLYLK